MEFECHLEVRTSQPVLFIRAQVPVGELPHLLGRAYGAIGAYLGEQGAEPAGPPFTAFYNMDMENLDVSAGFPVPKPLPGYGEIQAGEIAGGTYATCMYTGPYSGLTEAYAAVNRFIQEQSLQPSGLVYEFYFNDPNETTPEELGTLILFELKKD